MRPILALGLTLFEVLVSLFILSLMLLGLDVMELSAWHLSQQSYFEGLAYQELHNMEERLRMAGSFYPIDSLVREWNRENQQVLPQGRGLVSGSYPEYTLLLYWGGEQAEVCGRTKGAYEGCISKKYIL
jgi:hypothetical protein